ncbi:TIGR02186 family protein [Maritalea sp. S77]|uniref:TIGR02186 family protein n=1 Tax=Maritalea sp. S77 TaxID=3415125 RepID=UPI003C7C2B19
MRLLLALLTLAAVTIEASAQRLVMSTSEPVVSISSNFAGDTITIFGTIEPDVGGSAEQVTNNYNIVISIKGPSGTYVARKKTRQAGIWLNGEQEAFEGFPSYFALVSSAPLEKIADPGVLSVAGLAFDSAPHIRPVRRTQNTDPFAQELIRLMKKRGLYSLDEHGVQFLSDTFFSARIALPAHVPNGTYLANTYVFQEGQLIDNAPQRFTVRTVGFERFVANSAKEYSLLYGVVCVILAIFTGWLSGVVFRR